MAIDSMTNSMILNNKKANIQKWHKSNKRGGKTFNHKTIREFKYRWEPQAISFNDSSQWNDEHENGAFYELSAPKETNIPQFDRLYRKCPEQGIRHLVKHLINCYDPDEDLLYVVTVVCTHISGTKRGKKKDVYCYEIVFPARKRGRCGVKSFFLNQIKKKVTQQDDETWLHFDVKVDKCNREKEQA